MEATKVGYPSLVCTKQAEAVKPVTARDYAPPPRLVAIVGAQQYRMLDGRQRRPGEEPHLAQVGGARWYCPRMGRMRARALCRPAASLLARV